MTESMKGRPVWFELVTRDRDGAGRFYASVAGWTIHDDPDPSHGGYRIALADDGEAAAGLMTPVPGMTVPDGWRLYFGSDDVDADAARIAELGGQVTFGPMDIPGVGRFLVATDPQGIAFNLMRDTRGTKPTFCHREESRPGHGVWVELATSAPDAAIEFYGALFGWAKQGAMPMGDMGDYSFVGWGERDCPGAIMSSMTTGGVERWNWYVSVPDIDAAAVAVRDAGGTLIQGPDEIPGGQFSANLADPQGHSFGLVGPRLAGGCGMTDRLVTCLWFDNGEARNAAGFYAATFPDSHVGTAAAAPDDFPDGKAGSEITVEFTVLGRAFVGLNGGPAFRPNESVSFMVLTENQAETDRYWDAIVGNGGAESECGWCRDRWGFSWQITPRTLLDALAAGGDEARRAFAAMMTMKRIDVAAIDAARAG